MEAMASEGGAGGIRTLVQTSNNTTFYMLSFHLDFRLLPGRKLPSHSLSPIWVSQLHQRPAETRFTFTKSLYQMPQTMAFEWLPAFPPSGTRRNPTIIRIMQLGRSYYRRLKSVKYEIYELYPSARHAYSTIRPAVKTSRPHSPRRRGSLHNKRSIFSMNIHIDSLA